MPTLIERVLSTLFPVRNYRIKTSEEAKIWFQYEAPNHPTTDPYRVFADRDSWAGKVKCQECWVSNKQCDHVKKSNLRSSVFERIRTGPRAAASTGPETGKTDTASPYSA